MNATETNKLLYYRLVALWVLCEAMLGGVIHGLKLPVSGLFVGSSAVICICLIAYYVPVRTAIIKATIIVAIFKMMLSPQAPPMAYVAVFFQGFIAEAIFINRKFYKISCYLFAIIALTESALQRIIVSTVVYGMELWNAIDTFISNLTRTTSSYSLYIGVGYLILHVIAGFLIGFICSGLPKQIEQAHLISIKHEDYNPSATKGRRRLKQTAFIIWIILLLLYLQTEFKIGEPLLPSHLSIKILIRSSLILLCWYFIISPLLLNLVKKWLSKKQYRWKEDVDAILALLPTITSTVHQSWLATAHLNIYRRIITSVKLIAANIIRTT